MNKSKHAHYFSAASVQLDLVVRRAVRSSHTTHWNRVGEYGETYVISIETRAPPLIDGQWCVTCFARSREEYEE